MDSSLRLMALLGTCVLISACSINHPTVASSEPAPQSVATPTAKRLHLEDKTLTNDEVRKLFDQGYKPSIRNSQIYYCRREQQLGTRFETTICRTAEQMKQAEQDSKLLAAEKQRSSPCLQADRKPGC